MGLPSSSTAAGGPQFTRVLDLRPNMLPVNCVFVVLEKGKVERVYDQQATAICYATVADSSAAVTLQLWGDEVEAVNPGDIIRLTQGYFTLQKQALFVKAGRRGRIERIGEFCLLFTEVPNLSRVQWTTDPRTNQMSPVLTVDGQSNAATA